MRPLLVSASPAVSTSECKHICLRPEKFDSLTRTGFKDRMDMALLDLINDPSQVAQTATIKFGTN